MRDNASYFKVFLDVQGTRPQKKKAQNVGGQPTEASIDRAFETHVSRMEKSGIACPFQFYQILYQEYAHWQSP